MIQNSLFQAICRVGIFMICAQAIVHFRPNESYEKYLKLLMGIMVLIQLFAPVGGFFFRGGGAKAARLMEQFEKELADGMREAEKNAEKADRLLEQRTLEEVRRRAAEDKEAAFREGETQEREDRDSADGRAEIHIGLEGIEPVKIGQED